MRFWRLVFPIIKTPFPRISWISRSALPFARRVIWNSFLLIFALTEDPINENQTCVSRGRFFGPVVLRSRRRPGARQFSRGPDGAGLLSVPLSSRDGLHRGGTEGPPEMDRSGPLRFADEGV